MIAVRDDDRLCLLALAAVDYEGRRPSPLIYMRHLSQFALLPLMLLVGSLVTFQGRSVDAQEASSRTFDFVYEVTVGPVPAGEGPVDIFVPIARSGVHQDVLSYAVDASIKGTEGSEETYGNRFWHGHLDRSDGKAITVRMKVRVRRKKSSRGKMKEGARKAYTPKEQQKYALFLQANRRVPISGEPVDSIVKEIAPGEKSLLRVARATYDYVVDNMDYKKVGDGWGNGDTFWACSEKYGNCTDFHALFSSLVRARGIPARFEIGFPLPEDRDRGKIGGYHCWLEFYLPEIGWVPIDASEAKKHPEKRDFFFGTQPADRIQFSVGRDLELGAGHTTGPLNYFVYPHVEVGGKLYEKVEKRFSFEALAKWNKRPRGKARKP